MLQRADAAQSCRRDGLGRHAYERMFSIAKLAMPMGLPRCPWQGLMHTHR